MPPDTTQLTDLQDWMQGSILCGSQDHADVYVQGDERLSAGDRIAIYAQSYRQRLLECLRAEYPVLAALAGPTAFDLFARGYIAAHPSRSYTLYDFGARFADYLERSRPQGPQDAVEAIPAALARIERAKAEVLRAQGVERAAAAIEAAGIDPVIAEFLGLRVYWRADSVQLLALPFDFSETLAAAARGEVPPMPGRAASLIAVARARYRVGCHRLDAWQYAWLSALPTSAESARPLMSVDPRVVGWLPVALRLGFATSQCPSDPTYES